MERVLDVFWSIVGTVATFALGFIVGRLFGPYDRFRY